jgi:hypothetical protein
MSNYSPKVIAFCQAQQKFEGWYTPNQIVAGIPYPKGSVTFQANNPCAIKFSPWQTAPIPAGLGCLGRAATSPMGEYKNEQAGMDAGCEFLTDVITNQLIPFRNQAKLWGLKDSSELTIAQYFQIYAPSNADKNHPIQYGKFVADAIGVPVSTQIKNLLA